MRIARRNAMLAGGAKLYDAEVEYLESTGTQWIDTGVNVSDDNFVLSCDFMSTSSSQTAWSRYFGSYTSEAAASTRIIAYNTSGVRLYVGYRRQSDFQTSLTSDIASVRRKYVLSYSSLKIYNQDGSLFADVSLHAPSGLDDTSTVRIGPGAKMRLWIARFNMG